MALMFEYRTGMSLTDPWPFTVVRASTAYRIAKDGTLVQVAANTLRDNHYPFGLGNPVRTTLFEPTVINWCLRSQALATAPWAGTNLTTLSNNAAAAPDGTVTATSIVPNATNGVHYDKQTITITASEYIAVSAFVKASGYTGCQISATDFAGNQFRASVDLSAGTIAAMSNVGAAVLVGQKIIPLANGWYWIAAWGLSGGGGTSWSIYLPVFDTAAHAAADAVYAGDTTSGIYAWGAQFERNGAGAPKGASSYVPTVSATAARNDEKCSTPWPFQTQAMWCYTSWYDVGGSIWLQSAPIVTISNSTVNADPSWCPVFLRNNDKPGASWAAGCVTPQNGLLGSSRNTIAPAAGLATVAPYDFVETFSRVLKDGSTWFDARINGGAVFTNGPVGPTAAIPFVDIKNPTLYLGWAGALTGPQVALTCVKIGADPTRVTTLAMAASA